MNSFGPETVIIINELEKRSPIAGGTQGKFLVFKSSSFCLLKITWIAGGVEIFKSFIENRDLAKGMKEEETFKLKQFKYLYLFLADEINEVYYCIGCGSESNNFLIRGSFPTNMEQAFVVL